MLTPSTRLEDFPPLAGMAYLNTAAESIPPQCVSDAIRDYWRHKLRGMRGRNGHFARLEACREVSARLLGLTTDEVSFCSCSSEAYNLLGSALQLTASDEVICSDLDFPAGVTPWLRSDPAPRVRLWESADGSLRTDHLESLLGERTRLVQVSLVSFYNGHRLDWEPFHDTVRRLAPNALIAVDITQALGRVELRCSGADILISSTHKWTLGIHGGCIVGIPASGAERLTTRAGGWFHLENAFESDRFHRAVPKNGARSFSVGMPNFISLYALDAALRYVETAGIEAISAHADALVSMTDEGLRRLGLTPLCPWLPNNPSGIVAFKHPRSEEIHAALESEQVHVMHHAGRIRVAVHGYNTEEDITHLLDVLARSV